MINSSSKSTPEQILLPFRRCQTMQFDSYYTRGNEAVVKIIRGIANAEKQELLYLWGAKSSGKTHLLQAACKRMTERRGTVAYLPLRLLKQESPECIEGLERLDLITIDDIEVIANNMLWEESLLHLYNRIKNRQGSLIISSNENPSMSSIKLSDLKSRLSWGLEYRLTELNDADKARVLQCSAEQRGFELNKEVAGYLLTHVDRNLTHLMELLDKIDKQSLSEKRKVTIPFVKNFLC